MRAYYNDKGMVVVTMTPRQAGIFSIGICAGTTDKNLYKVRTTLRRVLRGLVDGIQRDAATHQADDKRVS